MPVSKDDKRFETETPSELDTRRQIAQVFFITRPLNSGSVGLYHGLSRNRTMALSAHHWMLFIVFSEVSMVIEGLLKDGVLVPKCSVFKETVPTKNLCILGMTEVSPAEVEQFAYSNPLNGTKYSFLTNNCHNWMNYVLKEMNLPLVPCNFINALCQILLFLVILVIGYLYLELLMFLWLEIMIVALNWSTLEGLLSYIDAYWKFIMCVDNSIKKCIPCGGLNLEDVLSDTKEQYTQVYQVKTLLKKSEISWKKLTHWKLLFAFFSYSVVIEGDHENNKLVSKCSLHKNNLGEEEYEFLGLVRISPAELKQLADNNSLNGSTYSIFNNSQKWANNVLEAVGLDAMSTANELLCFIIIYPLLATLLIVLYLLDCISSDGLDLILGEFQPLIWIGVTFWLIAVLFFLKNMNIS